MYSLPIVGEVAIIEIAYIQIQMWTEQYQQHNKLPKKPICLISQSAIAFSDVFRWCNGKIT